MVEPLCPLSTYPDWEPLACAFVGEIECHLLLQMLSTIFAKGLLKFQSLPQIGKAWQFGKTLTHFSHGGVDEIDWFALFPYLLHLLSEMRVISFIRPRRRRKNRYQFHQHFMYKFFVTTSFWQLFLCTCNQRKAAETTFVQKTHAYNVDEIDGRTLFVCDHTKKNTILPLF